MFIAVLPKYRARTHKLHISNQVYLYSPDSVRFCIFLILNHFCHAPLHASHSNHATTENTSVEKERKGNGCLRYSVEGVLFSQLIGRATDTKTSRQWNRKALKPDDYDSSTFLDIWQWHVKTTTTAWKYLVISIQFYSLFPCYDGHIILSRWMKYLWIWVSTTVL